LGKNIFVSKVTSKLTPGALSIVKTSQIFCADLVCNISSANDETKLMLSGKQQEI